MIRCSSAIGFADSHSCAETPAARRPEVPEIAVRPGTPLPRHAAESSKTTTCRRSDGTRCSTSRSRWPSRRNITVLQDLGQFTIGGKRRPCGSLRLQLPGDLEIPLILVKRRVQLRVQ